MAVTKWFVKGVSHVANAAVDWDTDTINVSLHTSTWTPDQDLHDFFDDVTNELAAGNGYTAGGVALANKTRTTDAATNETRLDADDPAWTFTALKTFRYAVYRKARGGAASVDEVIGYTDFEGDQAVNGAFSIQLATSGAFKITAAT